MRHFFSKLILLGVLAGAVGAGIVWWWLQKPLPLAYAGVELAIEPGMQPRAAAQAAVGAGLNVNPDLLALWFRLSGRWQSVRVGTYELTPGVTPRVLLDKLVSGDEVLRTITLLEGWNFRQLRAALADRAQLRPDTRAAPEAELMKLLGRPGEHPEGRFFPDTYAYVKGSSDAALLLRAMRAMDSQLADAWAQRSPQSVLKTPQEALILASIIEKETGRATERKHIAAVFNNRLRLGMPLQTDPTVIYGLGEAFDGDLRRADLRRDTPWNTYVHAGLPPTPIAMPGKEALLAAVQPAAEKSLYFVAKGDGSSQFSDTLEAHNLAVNKYQRGK